MPGRVVEKIPSLPMQMGREVDEARDGEGGRTIAKSRVPFVGEVSILFK